MFIKSLQQFFLFIDYIFLSQYREFLMRVYNVNTILRRLQCPSVRTDTYQFWRLLEKMGSHLGSGLPQMSYSQMGHHMDPHREDSH